MLDPLSSPACKSASLLTESLRNSTIHIHDTLLRLALVCKLCSSVITKIVWPQRLPCRVLGILWHLPPSWHILRIIHSAMLCCSYTRAQGISNTHDPGHVLGLLCQNSASLPPSGPCCSHTWEFAQGFSLAGWCAVGHAAVLCRESSDLLHSAHILMGLSLGGGSMRIRSSVHSQLHNESKVNLWYTRSCQTK